MTKTEKAVQWMEEVANDNSHGYSQNIRWGPDYDCSSMVISAWEQAGVPVKTRGATYTGNMYYIFLDCGFIDVTPSVYLPSGSGLQRGDVLLNHAEHTAMYIGGGQIVHARSSEGNTQLGDQSGNEIRIQPYFVYSSGWDAVLRYEGDERPDDDPEIELPEPSHYPDKITDVILRQGSTGWLVTALQSILNYYGADLDADGEFGRLTEQALINYQSNHSDADGARLEADGICGNKTWRSF